MKILQKLALAAFCLITLAAAAAAVAGEVDMKVNGEVRYRWFQDGTDFSPDADAYGYSELRTRLGVKVRPQEGLKLFFQFQDSRTIGDNSGGLVEDVDLGLHQGFLAYQPRENFWVQAGRFEMKYHGERLVGAVGWSNVARSFEGVRVGMDLGEAELEAFGSQLFESGDNGGLPDRYFWGLVASFPESGFDLFGYLDRDESDDDMTRTTLGAWSKREFGEGFDYEAIAAYQMGSYDDTDIDIAAYLLRTEIGYTNDSGLRFAGLVDYTSGDDPEEEDFGAFSNLYMTGHKFHGLMDIILSQYFPNYDAGLLDLALRFSAPLSDAWMLKADAHIFSTAEDFNPEGENSLGNEVDIVLNYTDGRLGWQNGLGIFSANEDSGFAGVEDPDTAIWFYSMMTASF